MTWSSKGSRPTARSSSTAFASTVGASFDGAAFSGGLSCRRAGFTGLTSFRRVTFGQPTSFDATRFEDAASFREAVFDGALSMEHTEFGRSASFHAVRFTNMALFRWTVFGAEALFDRARFIDAANFGRARFHSMVSFRDTEFSRPPQVEQARAVADSWSPLAGGHDSRTRSTTSGCCWSTVDRPAGRRQRAGGGRSPSRATPSTRSRCSGDGNWAMVRPLISRTTSSKPMSSRTTPAACARRISGSPAE